MKILLECRGIKPRTLFPQIFGEWKGCDPPLAIGEIAW